MKPNQSLFAHGVRRVVCLSVAGCVAISLLLVHPATAADADATNSAAAKAWQEFKDAVQPPKPPAEWQTQQPTPEEIAKFQEHRKELVAAAADKAHDFYTRFPDDPNAADAQKREFQLLNIAVQMGLTNRLAQLEAAEQKRLKDPSLTEDERFELRSTQIQRAAMGKQAEGNAAVMAQFEKGVRTLQKEFPKRPEIYQMLLEIASMREGDDARRLAKEIADSPASPEVKKEAAVLLKKLDAVGKPLAIKFKAVDGSEVDMAKLHGKVVLVDFWATWCGPCVRELPKVKVVYEQFHPKGFEIVGISFDQSKEKLTKFVEDKDMPWPQYFDGKGWGNDFGAEYGIHSIPAMWLVDKKGNLRDMNGREDLSAKVEKMLAE